MKKFKRLSALLIASIMTAGTVSSLSVGAFDFYTNTKEEVDEFIEKSYKVPADSFFTAHTVWYINNRDYIAKNEEHANSFDIYTLDDGNPNVASFDVKDNIDEEKLKKIIAEICPDAEYIRIISNSNNSTSVVIAGEDPTIHPRYHVYEEMRKKDVTLEQARKLRDIFNESYGLLNFEFKLKSVVPVKTSSPITEYVDKKTTDDGLSTLEQMKKYIAENNLDWDIITDAASKPFTYTIPDDNTFVISAGEDLSAEETYKVAEQIYNDLRLKPFIITLDNSSGISEDIVIDMHNNIGGDANNDGELSLADAVSIMQAVGNPDEYALTPQGKFNADISGNYDGLTNSDALAVQKKLLNLE